MLSKRKYPLRNYDVISRPPKTEGQYKISVASDSIFLPCLRGGAEGGGVTNTGEQYKTFFQQLSVNLFLPCLRGGAKGGGVTSIKHQLKISNNMKKMKKYRCKVCKWVYDPEFGDIKGGIPANTAFEDLPADWVCPVCKAERSKFEEMG